MHEIDAKLKNKHNKEILYTNFTHINDKGTKKFLNVHTDKKKFQSLLTLFQIGKNHDQMIESVT